MTRLLVSTRKGLFTFHHDSAASGAARWRLGDIQFRGDRVSATCVDPRDGACYAALDHGHFGVKLHRSDDDASFTEITAPTYPARPEGMVERDSQGREVPWSTQLLWSLAAGGADEPGALWCGTIPGGLFRSSDRGATWHLVESLWQKPDRKEWFGGGYDWPGIHSICVDPRSSRHVIIGISCGGAWRTRDRGETWETCSQGMYATYVPPERREDPRIQDPHRIVQCKSAPDVLWTQHHNGIFRSIDNAASWIDVGTDNAASRIDVGTDNAASWVDVGTDNAASWVDVGTDNAASWVDVGTDSAPLSTFGFAVAVHPGDGNTAWFVPAIADQHRMPVDARLAVTRTRDGGKSFEVLRDGLPDDCYDLVYRHALAVDGTGQILAFGSTTGNLWVSEDGGDHFTAVSHYLPPIACVELA